MELLQDLQKHFQSLVFTINMQYGNMISMNEFFDDCKSFASLFSDCLDLFDCIGERMITLEKENSTYRVSYLNQAFENLNQKANHFTNETSVHRGSN